MKSRSKPPSRAVSLENRVFVALLQAADTLAQEAEQLLKSAGLPAHNTMSYASSAGASPKGCPAVPSGTA